MHFGQKYHDTDRQARLYSGTQGLPGLGYHPNKFAHVSLFFQKKEGTIGGSCV
jgi:hypothetical protein